MNQERKDSVQTDQDIKAEKQHNTDVTTTETKPSSTSGTVQQRTAIKRRGGFHKGRRHFNAGIL